MLNKLVDVLKEVFWLKKTTPKKKKSVVRRVVAKKKAKPAKKPAKKPAALLKPKTEVKPTLAVKKPLKPAIDPSLAKVGEITHYFDRIKVAVVKITNGTVLIGDKVTIFGPKTKFVQKIWSMQIESQDVKVAKKGQVIGIKVDKTIAVGDVVFK